MNRPACEEPKIYSTNYLLDNIAIRDDEPVWTVEDVADYLKLQPETIRSMARRGELPAIKLGKVWRFNKSAIHEMIINVP